MILPFVRSPLAFGKHFPRRPDGGAGTADDGDEADEADADSVLKRWRKILCNPCNAMLTLSVLLYENAEFEASLTSIASDGRCPLECLAKPTDAARPLAQAVNELVDICLKATSAGAVTAAVSAPVSFRTLLRRKTDDNDEQGAAAENAAESERNDVWTKAVARRKTLAVVVPVARNGIHLTKDGLATAYSKCTTVTGFESKRDIGDGAKRESGDGASARAFVLSPECLTESSAEPWRHISNPAALDLEATLKFIASESKEGDVIVVFDNGLPLVRAVIQKELGSKPNQTEGWVIYTGSAGVRPKKKVPYATNQRETFFVSLAANRTRTALRQRKTYLLPGETASSDLDYVSVPRRNIGTAPLATVEDKARIFGIEPSNISPAPSEVAVHLGTGVPLFWQEQRPRDFYMTLFQQLGVGAVVDVAPGSGCKGEAALALGLPYCALALSVTHQRWLHNTFDRAALTHIVSKQSPLYMADLVQHIKKHFEDMLSETRGAVLDVEVADACAEQ